MNRLDLLIATPEQLQGLRRPSRQGISDLADALREADDFLRTLAAPDQPKTTFAVDDVLISFQAKANAKHLFGLKRKGLRPV